MTLCEGNPSVPGGFPSQRDSNVESISVSWHHSCLVQWCTLVLEIRWWVRIADAEPSSKFRHNTAKPSVCEFIASRKLICGAAQSIVKHLQDIFQLMLANVMTQVTFIWSYWRLHGILVLHKAIDKYYRLKNKFYKIYVQKLIINFWNWDIYWQLFPHQNDTVSQIKTSFTTESCASTMPNSYVSRRSHWVIMKSISTITTATTQNHIIFKSETIGKQWRTTFLHMELHKGS